MSRGLRWAPVPPPPPQPDPCARCGDRCAPFIIGPPAAPKAERFCGTCNQFQPATQAAIAEAARAAIGADDE